MLKSIIHIRKLLEDIVDLLRELLKMKMDLNENPQEVWGKWGADPSKNRLLETEDVIQILRISNAKYYRLVKSGELVPRRIGKRHYYLAIDLEKQLEESKRRGRI